MNLTVKIINFPFMSNKMTFCQKNWPWFAQKIRLFSLFFQKHKLQLLKATGDSNLQIVLDLLISKWCLAFLYLERNRRCDEMSFPNPSPDFQLFRSSYRNGGGSSRINFLSKLECYMNLPPSQVEFDEIFYLISRKIIWLRPNTSKLTFVLINLFWN